ncbi:MAG: DUF4843 domain-containing protein [Draconibacterium sp.]
MKLGYKILNLVVATLLLYSCSTDEIKPYQGVEYVYFGNQLVNYSFAYNPGYESIDIGYPVKLIGDSADYDRVVKFEIETRSDNLDNSDFELLPGIFRKGRFEDTIYVRCFNSEKLLTEEVSLTIRIASSEDFQPGPTEQITADLNFSNKLIQPEWWDNAVTRDYLGDYSDKKYRTLILATEVGDWTGLGASEKRSYAIMLANYIRENDVKEDDGTPMTVTVKY